MTDDNLTFACQAVHCWCLATMYKHCLTKYRIFQGVAHFTLSMNRATLCPILANKLKQFQINQPTRCINLSDLLLVVQIQLNMFRASSCPSSGAYKLQQPPLVYRWNVVVAVSLVVVVPDRPRPTTLLPPRSSCI